MKYSRTGSKILPINPMGKVTDRTFSPCTLLCPLYTTLCPVPGFEIGQTVHSIKPNQLSSGEPFLDTALAFVCEEQQGPECRFQRG